MTLRYRPGFMSINRQSHRGFRIMRTAFLTATLFALSATLITGCGGEGTGGAGSCGRLGLDVQQNEVAAYLFTDSEGGSQTVRLTILAFDLALDTSLTMQFEQAGAVRAVQYDTSCELGRNQNVSFSPEEAFALAGGGLLPSPKTAPVPPLPPTGTEVIASPPPPAEISIVCEPAIVTTPAGTFRVEKCLHVFAAGEFQSYENYSLSPGEPRPMASGVIKQRTVYADGSVRDVELIEWNGI